MTAAKLKPALWTTDKALGFAGAGLAAASATFGLYMTIHGPVTKGGTSGEFTVFAQLAPREAKRTHGPSTADNLDTAATASIAKRTAETADDAGVTPSIVTGIELRSAGDETAEIAIDGRMRKVRVGDTIPGAGEVLAILPGLRPMLKTSMGLIVSAAQ